MDAQLPVLYLRLIVGIFSRQPEDLSLPNCHRPHRALDGQTAIVGTCVSIQYAYKWQFGGVSGLFGGHFIGPSVITTTAVAVNEN